jgi:hypothetical protein
MRFFKKFILFLIIITAASLYYVNQQCAIIRLSYQIGQNKQAINSILDQNNYLMYNNNKQKAPQNIEMVLASSNLKLKMPEESQIVYLTKRREASPGEEIRTAGGILSSIFSVSAEAEAESTRQQP